MLEVSAAELAVMAGAELRGDPAALVGPDVIIDSRSVTPGCLFVALPGERVDGHDFAARAEAAGAGAVLVTRSVDVSVPQLVVADAAAALAVLAAAFVEQRLAAGLISIGVTGSSGKTSTKDLIAQVLAAAAPTVAAVGSANNEIGAPLTALKVDVTTRYLVNELGARGLGHISWLCGIVKPTVAVVTNVGHAHLGEFGSVEVIAKAKSELVAALPPGGWAVLNADDPRVSAMAELAPGPVATFAVGAEPTFGSIRVWASDVVADDRQRASFILHAAGAVTGSAPVRLQVSGWHQVPNALAAAAVGLTQDLRLGDIAAAVSEAVARSRWRMELVDAPDGSLVVNDAYNANPDSMDAALRAVAAMRRPSGRLVAVLGDMLELGPDSAEAHRRVGALAAELGFDTLFTVGEFADDLASGAGERGLSATVLPEPLAAVAAVRAIIAPPDVVLVKASRGLALEAVAQGLTAKAGMESER